MKLYDNLKSRLTPKAPAERERMKRLVVYTLLSLSFLVSIWIIFSPDSDGEAVKGRANMELPDQTSDGMPDTKLEAYEQEDMQRDKVKNDSTLNAVSCQLDTVNVTTGQAVPDEIQSSADAYRQAQESLQDFYVPDYSEPAQVAELQARLDELEMRDAALAQQTRQPDEMELLERSYQLAAQYMGNGNSNAGYQTSPQAEEKGKRNVQPVAQVNKNVVSSINVPASSQRLNTAVGFNSVSSKNTISAVVAGNQNVTDGESVRLEIEISSVECQGSIYDVELLVYDSDGQEGINIPNSMESDALHEIGANMGSTMGSSINISTSTGAQIASDVGRGLINGVSQYLTKKMRTVKVHLKAGYRVMLRQPENN